MSLPRHASWPDVRVPVTREMIRRIVEFLPRFERPGFLADDDNDALTPDASAFMEYLYADGWILPVTPQFDWQWWDATAENVVRRGQIEAADAETLRRLMTFVSRLDRTNEGASANAFDQGWFVRILRRLTELEAETPTEAGFAVESKRLERAVKESADAVAATLARRAGRTPPSSPRLTCGRHAVRVPSSSHPRPLVISRSTSFDETPPHGCTCFAAVAPGRGWCRRRSASGRSRTCRSRGSRALSCASPPWRPCRNAASWTSMATGPRAASLEESLVRVTPRAPSAAGR